jgi:hypothetical protein
VARLPDEINSGRGDSRKTCCCTKIDQVYTTKKVAQSFQKSCQRLQELCCCHHTALFKRLHVSRQILINHLCRAYEKVSLMRRIKQMNDLTASLAETRIKMRMDAYYKICYHFKRYKVSKIWCLSIYQLINLLDCVFTVIIV